MSKTREITEAGLFAALLVIFIIGGFFIPVLGYFLMIFTPVPIVILSVKNKIKYTIVSGIIAGLISSAFVTLPYGMTFAMLAILVGVPIGLGIKKEKSSLWMMAFSSIGALITFTLIYYLSEYITGISLMDTIQESFDLSASMQSGLTGLLGEVGLESSPERLEESLKILETMKSYITLIFPALLIATSVFYAGANMLFSHKIARHMKLPHRKLKPFGEFTYPMHVAYGSMFVFIGTYLLGVLGVANVGLIINNVLYLLILLFSVQGFSLVYSITSKRFGKGFSTAIVVMLLLFGGTYYVALAGYVDVLFNFRKLKR